MVITVWTLKFTFSSEHAVTSRIFSNCLLNESNFAQLFISSSNVLVGLGLMNVSCPALSVFKLHESSKCLPAAATQNQSIFRNDRNMPYQWTPEANHFIWIARQSSARQCWLASAYYSVPVGQAYRTPQDKTMDSDLANKISARLF